MFLVAVQNLQSTPDKPCALAELWNHAYSLGRQNGQGMDLFNAALCDDKVQEIHDDAWQEGFEEGVMKGEKVFVGHVSISECFAGQAVQQDTAVNMESVSVTCSVAVQSDVVEIPDSSTDYQSVAVRLSFNWADNVSSIPIHPTTFRNIDALQTESVLKPFLSLQ